MSEKDKPKSKWYLGLTDKLSTIPGGWDLYSIMGTGSTTATGDDTADTQSVEQSNPEQEAKMRTDWQLDQHFDRQDYPSRRDLSAY